MPVLIDREAGDLALFESGVILIYLAEASVASYQHQAQHAPRRCTGFDWADYPHLKRRRAEIGALPAAQR